MGTTVTYNGVTLLNVQTREWNQEVQYDESGTDAMYHVFRMRFEGLLHSGHDSTTSVSSGAAFGEMRLQYDSVYRRMLRTRGQLIVSVTNPSGNKTEIFRCDPTMGDIRPAAYTPGGNPHQDVDNGPKPKSFRVLQVIGSKCLRVAFEIECSKLICDQTYSSSGKATGLLPVILSNRWSVSETMDENHFMTKNISGRMRLSTASAASRISVKHVVIPGIEVGFRRVGLDFTTDKTGLECDYQITDRQVHTSAPWPATKISASHTQSTNEGINMVSEVRVEVEGPPYADKKLLLARAIQVIDAKLNLAQIKEGFKTRYIPEQITITDHIGDANRVDAAIRILETPGDEEAGIQKMFANLRDNMGKPLELPDINGVQYDPSLSPGPTVYGYYPPRGKDTVGSERRAAASLVFQCYLQQPCVDIHGIQKGALVSQSEEDDEEKPPYEATEVNEGGAPPYEPEEDNWSDGAKSSMYTYARATSRYSTDQCRVQLPVTGAESSATPQPTCKVFQLGLPQCRRIISIDYERAGKWPGIPKPNDTFTDEKLRGTLLENWIEAHPPGLTADGVTPLYRVTANYVYAMERPPTMSEKFRVGVAPQTAYKQADDAVKFKPSEAYENKELEP